MSSAPTDTRGPVHPAAAAVARVRAELAAVAEAPLWSMDPTEAGRTLVEVSRLKAQVAELELRVAAHADAMEVGREVGATSTANWWAHQTGMSRSEAHRLVRLAKLLDKEHPALRTALAAGQVNLEQAQIIARALADLPETVGAEVRGQAEAFLIDEAATHAPKQLKILGRRILEVLAPEIGEAHEATLLAREEAMAEAAAWLTMAEDGHGRWHGRFVLPALPGAALKKALLALSAPKHHAAVAGQAPAHGSKPTGQRLGEAFVAYVERYPADQLPHAGGVSAQLVITMPLDTLLGGLATARLDTGEVLSPARARMLACETGLIPAVLGGASEVLDLGRARRFHTKVQRIAKIVEQGGCTADGCDHPPGLCHLHHLNPWARGGRTNIRDATLLCPRHHARAHDPAYTMSRLPTGKYTFNRRT